MTTFEDYVKKAKLIHGDKYEYTELIKINKYSHLKIICKIHGEFIKRTGNHIVKKQGCSLCTKPAKLTTEMFIEKANNIHNNKYDYSESIYINGKNKIKIKCIQHGIFEQLPTNHLNGQNCPECQTNKKVTKEDFIKRSIKIHGNKYDYTNINFTIMTNPIEIICKNHGVFTQLPVYHVNGNGCYKCHGLTKTTEDFINKANKIHKNLYNYSKVKYENARKKILIICKQHGDFKQSPNDHLSGNGCTKCNKGNYSKVCIKWLDEISKKENIFIQHIGNTGEKILKINNKIFKLDGYCEKTNTIYEFLGDFWHGNPKIFNSNDINPVIKKSFGELYTNTMNREKILRENGYNLISIWENDYKK